MGNNPFAHLVLKVYKVEHVPDLSQKLSTKELECLVLGCKKEPKVFKEHEKEKYLTYMYKLPSQYLFILCKGIGMTSMGMTINTEEALCSSTDFQIYMHTIDMVWKALWKHAKEAKRPLLN